MSCWNFTTLHPEEPGRQREELPVHWMAHSICATPGRMGFRGSGPELGQARGGLLIQRTARPRCAPARAGAAGGSRRAVRAASVDLPWLLISIASRYRIAGKDTARTPARAASQGGSGPASRRRRGASPRESVVVATTASVVLRPRRSGTTRACSPHSTSDRSMALREMRFFLQLQEPVLAPQELSPGGGALRSSVWNQPSSGREVLVSSI